MPAGEPTASWQRRLALAAPETGGTRGQQGLNVLQRLNLPNWPSEVNRQVQRLLWGYYASHGERLTP